jgi:predicted nucleotidyltransferase
MKLLYNLQKVWDSKLVEYINQKYSYPAIVLFGSYATGRDSADSDVDIAIFTENKTKISLTKFEKQLNRKIQVFEVEMDEMKKNNPELLNSMLNGIVLSGELWTFNKD